MIGSFCFYISNKHFNLTIMKKIFLSLAFLFGIGMSVMADNTMQIKNDTIAVEDGFKTIDLKEVPQSIKESPWFHPQKRFSFSKARRCKIVQSSVCNQRRSRK